MASNQSIGGARKFLTRTLAAGALLAIYCMGTIAMTGAMMTTAVTSADARGRGGRGGGRGFRGGGRGRGFFRGRGVRRWVCRHHYWNSARRCYWVW